MCPQAVLGALLLAACAPAQAADPAWELLGGGSPDATVEIDRASLRRIDGLLTVWLRFDFAAPVQGRILAFRSAVAQHAIDCRGRRHATMRMTTYSGRLGEGDVVDRWDRSPGQWDWRPADGDPLDAGILGIGCDQAPATALSSPIVMSPQ